MADAVEATWQDMEQEAADEFVRREPHDALTDQAHIITTGADSYRFRRTAAQRKAWKS